MTRQELFSESVTRAEIPTHHYCLLSASTGEYLGIDDTGEFTLSSDTDDHVIWDTSSTGFLHVVTGRTISADIQGDSCLLTAGEEKLNLPDDKSINEKFLINHGPARLPSEYLRCLKENGWVCLTNILSAKLVEELERVACTDRYEHQKYDRSRHALCQNAAVARTVAEPVSLWLIRQYMQIQEIRIAHPPAFAILKKDDGERIVQGWHSDYPYHWGVPARGRVPTPSGQTVLGVQRNVCVSDFTKVGGATAFKLGSHAREEPPPREWGIAADHYKPGYRAAHGLPYSGPDADIVEAPGGSIILYDSRTWHRAGINRTDHKRAAMLQAMVPMYIMPKNDTSVAYKDFVHSPVYAELNDRERNEVQRLMVHQFIGPGGEYAIGPDSELTDLVRVDVDNR